MLRRNLFKKIITLVVIFCIFLTGYSIQAANIKTTEVHFHYYRFDQNYGPWDMWIWKHEPKSIEGVAYSFLDDSGEHSFGGKKVIVKLEGDLLDATTLGFIVRKPDWSAKDIDNDRFVSIKETQEGGVQHVYLAQGDPLIGDFLGDPNGPSKDAKFYSAFFIESNKIQFESSEQLNSSNVELTKDDIPLDIDVTINGNKGTVLLSENVDFSSSYVIKGTFLDGSSNSLEVTYDGIYDSPGFDASFYYDGDLGVVIKNNQTTFRLWAPISSSVTLNLYTSGTEEIDGGEKETPKKYDMLKEEKGTWYYEFDENMHNTYYTYSITNGKTTHEVVDPYAVSAGVNGRRGLVVDFDQVNPEGFIYNDRANNIINPTDAIIYELHVRDLTTHSSWNGTEENRGKFLGLVEKGTTYNGYTTGFDHILDLGVTHIQLIPIFDFGVVDETKLDDEEYNAFNWGYMPLHFNVPEGSYSTNPYDGLTRVSELKEVTMAYTKNNIRINMDVVYNHTGLSADSNFNLILPGYYHRKTTTGAFSNGSGTGNETASERSMVRKFFVDSLVFWATEYNISGFRFDLMALHDLETMNQIYTALTDIDPTIMVYGEPWMGGTSTLEDSLQAGKENLDKLPGIGAFNDDFRDAMKGSVFNKEYPGFVQGHYNEEILNRVKYGIVGGISHPSIRTSFLSHGKAWHGDPGKTINYVTAHDNNTLYDKLYQTNEITKNLHLIDEMVMQAYAVLMTSQGIVFMHAGDEFLRTKPSKDGVGFDQNSYESPDSVNQLRWDQKGLKDQAKVNAYIKGLIALRNSNADFRLSTKEDIIEKVSFVYEAFPGVLSYRIEGNKEILVLHNPTNKTLKIKLPTNHGYDLLVNKHTAGTDIIASYKAGQGIKVSPHETIVLYENESTETVSSWSAWIQSLNGYTSIDQKTPQSSAPFIILIVGISVVVLGLAVGVPLIVLNLKKKH